MVVIKHILRTHDVHAMVLDTDYIRTDKLYGENKMGYNLKHLKELAEFLEEINKLEIQKNFQKAIEKSIKENKICPRNVRYAEKNQWLETMSAMQTTKTNAGSIQIFREYVLSMTAR